MCPRFENSAKCSLHERERNSTRKIFVESTREMTEYEMKRMTRREARARNFAGNCTRHREK